MTTNRRPLNSEAAEKIFNKRAGVKAIEPKDIGKRDNFRVNGPGNDIDVKDKDGNFVMSVVEPGKILRKRIYNVTAVSMVALANPLIMDLYKQAQAEEAAGNTESASQLYNEFLNKCTISFGVLHPLPTEFQTLTKGDIVKGTVDMLTPEKDGTKGNLITLADVAVLPASPIGGLPKVSLGELIGQMQAFGEVSKTPFGKPAVTQPQGAE